MIPKSSKVLFSSSYSSDLLCVAMKRESTIYIVLYNQSGETKPYHLVVGNQVIDDGIKSHSVITYIL